MHLSTGDMLRAAAAQGTTLGRDADGYMRQGLLVPDALVLGILPGAARDPRYEARLHSRRVPP